MKLLFDKDGNGGKEIKDLLGFIDGGFSFKNIMMDVRTATKELIKTIGNDLYIDAVDIYDNGSLDDSEEELLLSIKYAIAFRAISIYAVKTDLAKTTNGRKMRADGEEKTPWDWMLDRDNEAMERGYYKAVDELLEFLDSTRNDTWMGSVEYAAMGVKLVRSTADFRVYYPQATRYMMLQLSPGLIRVQRDEIESRLTTAGLQDLHDLSVVSDLRIIQLAQEACVHGAIAWGLRHLRVTIFPEGILQAYTGDRNTTKARGVVEPNIAITVAEQFERDMRRNLLDLEERLRALNPPDTTTEQKKQPYRQGYIANHKFFSA